MSATTRLVVVLTVGLMVLFGCDRSETGGGAAPQGGASSDDGHDHGSEPSSRADPGDGEVVAFDEVGLLVAASGLFDAIADRTATDVAAAATADRAFVTASGVYAFLETPDNDARLGGLPPGSVVRLKGSLLPRGLLLHVDTVAVLDATTVDVQATAADAGKPVTLAGVNQCMCGIKIKAMHTSCKLGHLHHLVTGDGKIYHYLQFDQGRDAMATMDFHSKPIRVEAREFPGQFLLVESIEVAQN